ncbi:MAG: helix-turn-helix transcriptional regulator [Terrisporobacter sp.]|uniref:helix-turn-helix domain-containing protein n=1 Tax=Terrisporobacter sp. TaxID=1965305 RepID=UPI002FCC905A
MEKINFSKNLLGLRKKRKITQEELANYLGITKAAVSKWELGQSYPDITLLPIIASYFDISIDILIGYEPIMDKDEVRKIYTQLIEEFSVNDFYNVYNKCIEYEKKYYTCYFLQFHLGLLYCNHANLAGEQDKIKEIFEHALEVFVRIQNDCNDVKLAKSALSLKSYCNLVLGKPDEIIEELGDIYDIPLPSEMILSKAYMVKGNNKKAIQTLQIYMFNNFMNNIGAMTDMLCCYNDNIDKLQLYLDKLIKLTDLLELKTEYPQGILSVYPVISIIYASMEDKDKCIYYLEECVDVIAEKKVFEMNKNENKIFDYVPEYLEGMDIGNILPRKENLIIDSFKELILNNPALMIIRDDIRYDNLIEKLEKIK